MGLGSLRTSPFSNLSFTRMVTEGNNREGEGGGERAEDPPAQKYPRVCSTTTSSPPTSFTSPSHLSESSSRSAESLGNYKNGVRRVKSGLGEESQVCLDQPCESTHLPRMVVEGVALPQSDLEECAVVLEDCGGLRDSVNTSGDSVREQVDGSGCGGSDGEQRSSPPPLCLPPPPTLVASPLLGGPFSTGSRKHREFTPESRKDESYWEKRRKNNEAARKSREKRRLHDLMLENRIVGLQEDNSRLREELHSLKKRYGIPLDTVFMTQTTTERVSDDPSSHVGVNPRRSSFSACEGGMPPRLTPPSSLLTLTPTGLPATVQQMGVTGVFPPHSSSLPFLMPAFPAELPQAHTPSSHTVAYPFIPVVQQQDNAMLVKTERAAEDDTSPQHVAIKQERYDEEEMPDYKEMHPRYTSGSSQALAAPITPALVNAHYGWSEVLPSTQNVDQVPAHRWQRSPLSCNGSDDTSDEPLQLTVHRRGSKAESVGEESGSEGASVKSSPCSPDSCFSSPSSLPVKLRYKRPANTSPLHQQNLGGLNNTASLSSVNGLVAGLFRTTSALAPSQLNGILQLSELSLPQETPLSLVKRESPETQDSPLSLVKKEPAVSAEAACQEANDSRNPADAPNPDPKYLERRRRNNEAARKCREKRRNLTRLREAKSDHLVTENSQLRQELDSLQVEMKQLRDLLDQKHRENEEGQEISQQQLVLSQEHAKRLQQLHKEHRLLKLEQRRLEKKQEKRQQQLQKQRMNNLVIDTVDDHGDVN